MADNYGQVYTFILYSLFIGVLLGVIYDVFRIVRMAFTVPGIVADIYRPRKHRSRLAVNVIVFVCDILFFVVAAVISAIFIFHANNGRIRGIALFGSLVGFAVYYNTVGRLVTLISGGIISAVCHMFHFIVCSIILPIWRAWVGLCDLIYTHRRTRSMIRSFKRKGS